MFSVDADMLFFCDKQVNLELRYVYTHTVTLKMLIRNNV